MFASKLKMMLAMPLLLGMLGTRGASAPQDRYGDPLPPGAVARMGTVRFHQAAWNAALVFAPDGKAVISTGHGKNPIVFWDAKTGRRLRQIESQEKEMGVLAFAPDGKLLASADWNAIHLWNPASGKEARAMAQNFVDSLAFAPDGKILASCGRDGLQNHSVRLWNVASGKELWRIPRLEQVIHTVLFAPDGKTLIWSGRDDVIHFWDVLSRKEIREISENLGTNLVMALSPDGKVLAVGGWQNRGGQPRGVVRLLDTASGKELRVLGEQEYWLDSMVFSPDGKLLVSTDGVDLRLWDRATDREVRLIHSRVRMTASPVFSPDSKTLAMRTPSAIRLFDAATGKPLHDWPGHDQGVHTLAFSRDGKMLASGGGDIRLWEAETGKQLRVLPGSRHAIDTWVRAIALTPDGRSLISSGAERTLYRYDLATGKETGSFLISESAAKEDRQQVLVMNLSADGKTLAALSTGFHEAEDPLILSVWDAVSGKRLAQHRLPHDRSRPWGLLLPDSRTVILQVKEKLVLRDAMTGRQIFVFTADVRSFSYKWAVSSDGKLLATRNFSLTPATEETKTKKSKRQVTARYVQLWELDTGKELLRIPTKSQGHCLALSPDGKMLAGDDDREIVVWDVADGTKLRSFSGYEPPVHSLVFSFDGKRLASGLADGTVLVWDAAAAWAVRKFPKADEKDLERLWNDLAGDDGPKAHAAIGRLATVPERAVPLLAKRLRPIAAVPQERMRRLLADLDSGDFEVRETATRELEKLDELAELALRRTLNAKPSLEARKRIKGLLAGQRRVPAGEALRRLRAIRVLEHIGTEEARRLLAMLAGGAPAARATTAAQAALERLHY